MAHLHSVYDSDMHFSIDPITRAIRNESGKNSLVQYDHNSERFTFELPRYIEEHDMKLCNRVEVHYLNIGRGGEQNADVYEVNDWQISPDDNGIVICSWLLSANATQLAGSLSFLLRFACVADDGTIEYAWHTEIYSGISVSNGMYNGEAVVAEFPDVLEAWKTEVLADMNELVAKAEEVAERYKLPMIVNVHEDNNGSLSCDTTLQDILAAYYEGMEVKCKYWADGGDGYEICIATLPLASTMPGVGAYFSAIDAREANWEDWNAYYISYVNITTEGISTGRTRIDLEQYNETSQTVSNITVKEYESENINAEITRGFCNANSGIYSANNGYKSMKFAYDGNSKIFVTTYILADVLAIACFYDENDNFISSTGTETETKWFTDYELDIPENTAYIAINCRYTGTEDPSAYIGLGEKVYCDYSKMLHGKKIVNFGDSIFGNYRDTNPSDKSISAYIAEKTGATVYNGGFGGCRMANHSQYWNDFSMDSLADAIASGDWAPQETAIANQSALPEYFAETVEMLKGINWNNIDVITIGYGTNDYTGNVAIADFKEALRYSIQKILTAYPHLQIIVVSPMWRWFLSGGTYSHNSDDEASKNTNGDMLPDYVAACEEIAKQAHVPYLDTYYDMGINQYNYLHYFAASDGTHPSNIGREMRARYISNKLKLIL